MCSSDLETALNTADEGSRGMSPKDFVEKSEWIKGPDFLKESAESWLKKEKYEEHVDADSPEVKNVNVNTSAVEESSDILKRLQRFSSWYKAKVAVALCLKYKVKFLQRRRHPALEYSRTSIIRTSIIRTLRLSGLFFLVPIFS